MAKSPFSSKLFTTKATKAAHKGNGPLDKQSALDKLPPLGNLSPLELLPIKDQTQQEAAQHEVKNRSAALQIKIAKAIDRADKNFFNENYTNQAEAVLALLSKEGLVIVPEEPDQRIVEAGIEALKTGRYRPNDVVSHLYKQLIAAAKL